MSLFNCEIELDLLWSKECITREISIIPRVAPNLDANPAVQAVPAIRTTGAIFQINNAKLDVPVGTLSINDNIQFLENIKQGFKRTIFWSKKSIFKQIKIWNNNTTKKQ